MRRSGALRHRGKWGGGAVAPSPRRCGGSPSLTRGSPSPLRSSGPMGASRRGAVVFGSLPPCVVRAACCALRGLWPLGARPARRAFSPSFAALRPWLRRCAASPLAVRARAPAPPGAPLCPRVGGAARGGLVAPVGGGRRSPPGGCCGSGLFSPLPFRAARPPPPLPFAVYRGAYFPLCRVVAFPLALVAFCALVAFLGLCGPSCAVGPRRDQWCSCPAASRALPASLPVLFPLSDFPEVNSLSGPRHRLFAAVYSPEIVNRLPT